MGFDYENRQYLEHLNQKSQGWFDAVMLQVHACSPRRVLELGCGDGQFSRILGEAGYQTVSLDYSNTFLEYAKTHNQTENNRFLQWNLNQQPLTELLAYEAPFDVIVMVDVLEHIQERSRVLQELPALLNAGGSFVLQCPNLYCNVVSTNYIHSPVNMLKKLLRGVTGWFKMITGCQPDQITEIQYGLDYLFADHDAVVLTSPFYLRAELQRKVWQKKYFTCYASDSPHTIIRGFWNLWRFFPFIKHLGGRMVLRYRLRISGGNGSKSTR